MTPPKAQPEAGVTDAEADEQAEDQAEIQSSPEQDGTASDGSEVPGHAAPKRRSAAMEVRVGRKRSGAATAAKPDEGEASAKTKMSRSTRNLPKRAPRDAPATGSRVGPRAQRRAARAELADAAEAGSAEIATSGKAVVDLQDDDTDIGNQTSELVAEVPVAPSVPVMKSVVSAPHRAAPADGVALPVPVELADDGDEEPAPGVRRRNGPRSEKRGSRPTKNDASNYVVAPTVSPAQMRPRHYGVIVSFFLFVVVPTISYSWYLWTLAADQYQSDVGFGSRTEEVGSTFDFLGALGGTTQSGSKDMDILNQFIVSQELVAKVDAKVDLRAMYTKAGQDPLNAFHPDGSIEDLVKYWQRMVLVNYDNGTGLMNLEVFAFDPVDAKTIAEVVLVESTQIINELSKTAQDDTTRYSKEALAATEAKLAEARLAVLDFQIRNRIVDPSNVIANQLSVVSTLNQQLAGAQIELDMIAGTVPEKDPRIAQLNRRIEVVQNRIFEEQAKVGAVADSASPGFATLMADFERLKVDQDFAQQAYLSARASYNQAVSDAQHKTRYLSTYVTPTLAESSTAPNRPMTAFLVALVAAILWAIVVLVYYALRDRR